MAEDKKRLRVKSYPRPTEYCGAMLPAAHSGGASLISLLVPPLTHQARSAACLE